MKARDELRTATLRMVLTAVSAEEVSGKEARAAHRRRGAGRAAPGGQEAPGGRRGVRRRGPGRAGAREQAEGEVLADYLPAQLDDADLAAIVADVITRTGAAGMKDMGRVMGAVQGASPAGPTAHGWPRRSAASWAEARRARSSSPPRCPAAVAAAVAAAAVAAAVAVPSPRAAPSGAAGSRGPAAGREPLLTRIADDLVDRRGRRPPGRCRGRCRPAGRCRPRAWLPGSRRPAARPCRRAPTSSRHQPGVAVLHGRVGGGNGTVGWPVRIGAIASCQIVAPACCRRSRRRSRPLRVEHHHAGRVLRGVADEGGRELRSCDVPVLPAIW